MYNLFWRGSYSSEISCYHYELKRLYDLMTGTSDAGETLQSIVIKSAAYCKKEKSPRHEFIWIQFENPALPDVWNYMVLDRNKFGEEPDPRGAIWPSIQESGSVVAQDEFRVSCDGNLNKLLKRCGLAPCRTIETITFSVGHFLPLYHFAAVAVAAHELRNRYHLIQANCYWFAGIVWGYIIDNCPNIKHVVREGTRGKFGVLFSHTTDSAELVEVRVRVQELLSSRILDGAFDTHAALETLIPPGELFMPNIVGPGEDTRDEALEAKDARWRAFEAMIEQMPPRARMYYLRNLADLVGEMNTSRAQYLDGQVESDGSSLRTPDATEVGLSESGYDKSSILGEYLFRVDGPSILGEIAVTPGGEHEEDALSRAAATTDEAGVVGDHMGCNGLAGPQRDLNSDDELESVLEESESLSEHDREDRTAAMIIVNAEGCPVSQLDVQTGTTHLLLGSSPTASAIPPFLAQILPQISSTLLCLDISNNELTTLPAALTSCIQLEELNVSNNPLRTLPSTLGALISLRVLITDGCEITSLPSQLVQLGALHSLSVRSNRLVMLPVWMCAMPSLEVLKIEGNTFAGPWRNLVEPLLPRTTDNGSEGLTVDEEGARQHRALRGIIENMPAMPARPQPIAPPPAPPRVDVTSARMLSSKRPQEGLNGAPSPGFLQALPSPAPRAKRRSILPFDTPPTLNIPIPSGEPFMSNFVAVGGDPEDEGLAAEEAERRADEEAARQHLALRGIMSYLRDMADLEGGVNPTQARSMNEQPSSGGLYASSTRTQSTLRSALSTASLRRNSVNSTDSGCSLGPSTEYRDLRNNKSWRIAIVKAIIETERSYVKGLQELLDIYVKPASEPAPGLNVSRETIIPAAERNIVFTGVDALLQFHKQNFLPSLISAADIPSTAGPGEDVSTRAAHAIANVFVSHAAFMKMYFAYINNVDHAIQRIQIWDDSTLIPNPPGSNTPNAVDLGLNTIPSDLAITIATQAPRIALNAAKRKRIKQFLQRCRSNPRHSQLNLEDYLSLPIQRIPTYMVLLDNLVTCTPPHPEARDDPLERALEAIAVLANSMNEGKRESESRAKLVYWQSRIRGRFMSPLVQPHRRLIMDGRLQLVRLVKKVNSRVEMTGADGSLSQVEVPCLSSDANPKQLVAILCNDLLVLCKETPGAEQVELWAVLRMNTIAQPASILPGNGLRIVDNKAILYFSTQSTSEALTWQQAINLHIPQSN